MLVPNLTVVENIALGMKEAHSKGLVQPAVVRQKIEEVSRRYGLAVDPDAYVWQLSVGEQQRVELVKTLCYGARFLILDEPTSALTPQETDELIVLLQSMASELSIIFISHKLQEVKTLSHKVSILRHGQVVFSGNTEDYTPSQLASFMTGNSVELPTNKHKGKPGDTILDIQSLRVKSDRNFYALDDLNLSIRAGEIVGLAGVSGNGQKELAEVINGLRKAEGGSVLFEGNEIVNKTPGEIISAGMGYIPEDRNTEGIIPSFSIRENLILKDNSGEKYSHKSFLKLKTISDSAEELKDQFDIRCPHTNIPAGALSGGNIQKVILAREIDRSPRFLIAVYPTRGLDMGAIEFIHTQLLNLKEQGIGVLLISEELDEIINLSDRVAVIYKGKIMNILEGSSATKQKLGLLMAGVSDDK
jgi:simple sugar transport system ATP-binding protein